MVGVIWRMVVDTRPSLSLNVSYHEGLPSASGLCWGILTGLGVLMVNHIGFAIIGVYGELVSTKMAIGGYERHQTQVTLRHEKDIMLCFRFPT